MLESESLQRTESDPPVRTLKIEADGDRWKGIKPKIRLMGRWLERAGFRPGNRVHITCVAPGIIELSSSDTSVDESKPPSLQQSEQPF
jgi:type I toxin-antitoxin system toxin SymE